MLIKRRKLLQSGALAAAGTLLVPKFLKAGHQHLLPGRQEKILVVIQLSGGNDGLNTVIPVRNDIYYRERPKLAIKRETSLPLNDEASLHPALTAFRQFHDEGELAILNSVGYPNPDRSHFRSMDIWHSASGSREYWTTGWLGRYLDAACNNCGTPTQVVEIDDVLSLALKGEHHKGIALTDPRKLKQAAGDPFFKAIDDHGHEHEPMADYLYKTLAETLQSADYLHECSKQTSNRPGYPDSELGRSLRTVASLIAGDANSRVFYTSLGSFDTHINQAFTQNRLFGELNDAVAAFVKDMKQVNRMDDVLIVTFSEFGRRVAQNASSGTDHGTANNMFVIGTKLKQHGLLNSMPNLERLQDGDLPYELDFRRVYATLLDGWLGANSKQILQSEFEPLPFI